MIVRPGSSRRGLSILFARASDRDRLLADVLLEMETEELLHMPVVDDGRVVGVIARDRILGVLRQAGLLSSARA